VKIPNLDIHKHLPLILLTSGVTGYFGSMIFAIQATPEGMDVWNDDELNNKERALKLLPIYGLTAGTFVLSTAAVILSYTVQSKRADALFALYTVTDKSLQSYRKAVSERVTKKVHTDIEEAVRPLPIVTEVAGTGNTLCFDMWSGRYFRTASVEVLRRVFISTNETLYSDGFVPLNSFYADVGLPRVKPGDDIGWEIDSGPIEFELTSGLTDADEPCLVVGFDLSYRWIKKRNLNE